MRILHCCLSNFFIENYNYQENMLTRQNKSDGHEVMVIASTEVFTDNKSYGYVEPCDYVNKDGIRVVRVPYKKIFNHAVSRKFRAYKGVYSLVEEFAPDIIVFHGMSAWELKVIVKYKKTHDVKLYVDNHAGRSNSGRTWFSLNVLHGVFYKSILKSALPFIEKLFCVDLREYEFAEVIYKVPKSKLELWPLGGVIQDDREYDEVRIIGREKLGLSDDLTMFFHSGRMDKDKKTIEVLRAFSTIPDEKFRLFIAGSFFDDVKEDALNLIEHDPRIEYLGWIAGEELWELLAATDVYVQPGTRSVTMQNAMCYRCAVIVRPHEMYRYLLEDDGIYVSTEQDIVEALRGMSENKEKIGNVKERVFARAKEKLDYRELAARIYK